MRSIEAFRSRTRTAVTGRVETVKPELNEWNTYLYKMADRIQNSLLLLLLMAFIADHVSDQVYVFVLQTDRNMTCISKLRVEKQPSDYICFWLFIARR